MIAPASAEFTGEMPPASAPRSDVVIDNLVNSYKRNIAKAGLTDRGRYDAFGYRSAQVARTSGAAMPSGGSADYQVRYDRLDLLRLSQAFDRDNGLYRGVINRACDNIIGNGFKLQMRTGSARLNSKIEALFEDEFSLDPEVRGLFTWSQSENVALRSLFVDGDIGAIKTDLGKIQFIESERIRHLLMSGQIQNGNLIEQGVEMDRVGRPVAFHVADYGIYGQVEIQSAKRYSADDFIFLANIERASQTRGVPVMASNFSMFNRISDVCDSEAIAWQMLARFAVAITRENAAQLAYNTSNADTDIDGAGNIPATPQDMASRVHDLAQALIFHGNPGEKIQGIDRNLPGANFPASITMFIRLLGLPVGMPLELVLLDWSKTNYSSARAALEQAFRMFTAWQRKLRQRWHTPILSWKIDQWLAEGRIAPRSDIYAHDWICPSFPWIDQLKEAQAWGERIDRGLATMTEALKSLNQDREQWLVQRQREIEEAIAVADTINAKHPNANVDWRLLAGYKISITEKDQPATNDDSKETGDDKKTVKSTDEEGGSPSED